MFIDLVPRDARRRVRYSATKARLVVIWAPRDARSLIQRHDKRAVCDFCVRIAKRNMSDKQVSVEDLQLKSIFFELLEVGAKSEVLA